jgi:preprotein translocase subunit SecG
MYSVFLVIHIIICFLLIVSILVFQTSKGSALSMFGGGDSLFATSGGTTFIKKFTMYLAIAFAINSLILTSLSPTRNRSVIESVAIPQMPAKK